MQTRKKVIKTVYKDENDSEPEESGDFSDSGSDAKISDVSSSEDEEQAVSSGEEFEDKESKSSKATKSAPRRRPQFAKNFIQKILDESQEDLGENSSTKAFSVKDLTDADKLLPSFLNLSESDSSEDESPRKPPSVPANTTFPSFDDTDSDHETKIIKEYQDVWSENIPDKSDEIAQKTFKELEIHKTKVEQTKASILNYKAVSSQAFDVRDLLAQGEELLPEPAEIKNTKRKKKQYVSDSEMEDWEEVKESKSLPASGLQVVVDFPDTVRRKSKKIDVEMMMRRKMNRVKKEYQVYMHKVHVLCWLGHGNYVSSVLNDQEIMSAVLTLVPSKECYPGERVDVKYVEQITKWFKNKMTLVQDKHENKFKPKSPPLKDILLKEIKNKTVSTKKFLIFIFVSMLRALGLQCRVMFNFVTLPIRPPSSELCSLSTKQKNEKQNAEPKKEDTNKSAQKKTCTLKKKSKESIPQVDGNYDSDMDVDDSYFSDTNIMQVDGNDDGNIEAKSRKTRRSQAPIATEQTEMDEDVSPPKRTRRSAANPSNSEPLNIVSENKTSPKTSNRKVSEVKSKFEETKPVKVEPSNKASSVFKKLSLNRHCKANKENEPKESKHEISSSSQESPNKKKTAPEQSDPPKIIVTNEKNKAVFESNSSAELSKCTTRSRSKNADVKNVQNAKDSINNNTKTRSKSAGTSDSSSTFVKSNTAQNKSATRSRSKPVDVKNVQNVKAFVDTNTKTRSKNADTTETGTTFIESNTAQSKSATRSRSKTANLRTVQIAKDHVNKNTKTRSKSAGTSDSSGTIFESNTAKNKSTTRSRSKTADVRNIQYAKDSRDTNTKTRSKNADISETGSTLVASNSNTAQSKFTTRSRSKTADVKNVLNAKDSINNNTKTRSKSAGTSETSKYLNDSEKTPTKIDPKKTKKTLKDMDDELRGRKTKISPKNAVRMEESLKNKAVKKKSVKGKSKTKSDSDYEPEALSDDDFKPSKISPKPSGSRKIDRRVLSTDDEAPRDKTDVWCEVFVEELEQWIAVDVVKGQVHCTNEIYSRATHPVCYVVGWDNNNYLKDLTRRYVPHWNTVTRKQRAEPVWWDTAISPWKGPRTPRDREEDEALDRMQLDAPLPTSIAEYKNHPLYVLKRHLLKYEALYPPNTATLGFVRGEAVYPRDSVCVCHSRHTWYKLAKVVRQGEQPYKIVKANPRWDKVARKVISVDEPLETFGSWQVEDFEPPAAENGVVPRNAYGNVELFKACMLPKGTVHIKLPGLNKVANKLNIDCAPALTGFDGNRGWPRPLYDGFVVCQEFEEIITQAWLEDQEKMERREKEKTEARVFGNWKRLIKGLMIKERLKLKYGFEEPSTSDKAKGPKGSRFVTKKKK